MPPVVWHQDWVMRVQEPSCLQQAPLEQVIRPQGTPAPAAVLGEVQANAAMTTQEPVMAQQAPG